MEANVGGGCETGESLGNWKQAKYSKQKCVELKQEVSTF